MQTMESKLAGWAAQNKKVDKPAEPASVEVKTAEPESTDPQSKVEPQAEVKKPEPKEEAKPTEVSEKTIEQEVVTSWDADVADAKKEESKIDVDWNSIGSALEFPEIKTKEDLIAKATELKSKLKEYEEKPLAGIPDEFKEVLEVTKSGVDWKDYLSNQLIDYSKIDPIQLFEDEFFRDAARNPKYFTDGKFNAQLAEDALDALPEVYREQMGRSIQQGFIQSQKQRQQELRAKAEAKITQAEKSLTTATKNLNELLPFEDYGIKFEPKHSSEIYQGISSSKLTRKHLGVNYEDLVRSGADMKAISATIAKAEYAEKMLKFKSQAAKVEAKKEILDKIQNPQIKSTGTNVQPESETKKELTPAEKMALYIKSQKKGL
jgi:hypothetical protein